MKQRASGCIPSLVSDIYDLVPGRQAALFRNNHNYFIIYSIIVYYLFMIYPSLATWYEAEAKCSQMAPNGHLVAITNSEIQQVVDAVITNR